MVTMEADGREGSSSSYYSILGVGSDSSIEEIRRAYRKLAMQWHPDRWTRTPSLLGEAKRKFQQIQETYSVLSDHKKRTIYDAGLYDPQEEDDEEKDCGLEELQSMFTELAEGFESPSWYCGVPSGLDEYRCSKRTRLDTKLMENQGSHFEVPSLNLCETRGYCN